MVKAHMTQSNRVQLLPTGYEVLPLLHKFSRFLLVGGVCTVLQYALLILFVEEIHTSPTVASTIGYVASSLVNYLLNYSFTFRSTAGHRRSVPRFLVIALCGLALNGAVTFLGTAVLGLHYLLVQVIATCLTLIWNFVANLRWTF